MKSKPGIGESGRKAEKLTIARMKAREMLNSGAVPGAKGDFEIERGDHEVKVELKTTTTKSLSMRYDWCVKISDEAVTVGKVPALAFQFIHEDGRPKRYGSWVAIPEWLFNELF